MITTNLFEETMRRNPHLGQYIKRYEQESGLTPEFHEQLTYDMRYVKNPNIIYPVGDPIFVHIYKDMTSSEIKYVAIEPSLSEEQEQKRKKIVDWIYDKVPEVDFDKEPDVRSVILRLYNDITSIKKSFLKRTDYVHLNKEEHELIEYYILRDTLESGKLQPLMKDPYIEDIHCIGLDPIHLNHKIFQMIETNVRFSSWEELDSYLKTLGEKVGSPVSEGHPIIDAAMPDGSRLNVVYSKDVSIRGSSFTIRKFSEEPISITQLIRFGTLSAEIAAYIWLCLENDMSVFMCGETASGKTTTLNAIVPFIPADAKIYSVEETPELHVPHETWQQMLTRDTGQTQGNVTMFDLLKAALRSRPHYIIVGEIRGPEGAIAFQAMQTGHPVLSTFHASSARKMIQRLTGTPISVPIQFMDLLNVAIFQQIVYVNGALERRVTSVEEIIGYSRENQGIMTRKIFSYDPVRDVHKFDGLFNSAMLEAKIAPRYGMEDPREIYAMLAKRTKILKALTDANITSYRRVLQIINEYRIEGDSALPSEVRAEVR
jgi:flagellar protein FlaI